MDLFEKVFEKYWQLKNSTKRLSKENVVLENHIKAFDLFVLAQMPKEFQFQINPSHGFVGFCGQHLYLPEKIQYLSDFELNRCLYLNLILMSCAVHNLNLRLHKDMSEVAARLITLQNIKKINSYLDKQFDNYSFFQKKIFIAIQDHFLKNNRLRLNINSFEQEMFDVWSQIYLLRENDQKNNEDIFFSLNFKKNQSVPDFLLMTVPCLNHEMTSTSEKSDIQFTKNKNGDNQIKTEKEKKHSSPPKLVDYEKEELNPVVHSFEKMETVEEYQGGRRIESGEDELTNHEDALNELDLNKMTRGGESVQSIFRSNIFSIFSDFKTEEQKLTQKGHYYPEWSSTRDVYLKNHCILFETVAVAEDSSSFFRQTVYDKNYEQISYWQKKIYNFFNIPVWKRRLKDGSEIDYDSFVQDYTALISHKNVSQRWYSQKKNQDQDVAVFILFDQSLSTDSWIKNERIIDITLSSIAQVGILFENIIQYVHVAGTWSSTRHNCQFQYYKLAHEPWNCFFNRVQYIEPQGYTRLGPAIRHASQILSQEKHDKKLLLILTDGKPTDVDGYEGLHGINDIKHACLDAEASGVLVHALTLDQDSRLYFPKMFRYYRTLKNSQNFSEELYRVLMQVFKRS